MNFSVFANINIVALLIEVLGVKNVK